MVDGLRQTTEALMDSLAFFPNLETLLMCTVFENA